MGSGPVIVVVDANVLFPFTLRDTVLRLAAANLYQLRWSNEILNEMERNLVKSVAMPVDKAKRLRAKMEQVFPEAMVTGYEPLVRSMENDTKDRHVAAAAVKSDARIIVTNNLKDFKRLPDGIQAQSPDEFLCQLFRMAPNQVVQSLREQAVDLQRPPVAFGALLERLALPAPGLVNFVKTYIGLPE